MVNKLIIKGKLIKTYTNKIWECGCDEAGRGCLAGPVVAAAVVLSPGFDNKTLDDSKKLSADQRTHLRSVIEKEALDYAVAFVAAETIDQINILQATFRAMHQALDRLRNRPEHILVDGNRFAPYKGLPHSCHIKGDGAFMSIAAASVLAKTYRDEFMRELHEEFPQYCWDQNKGYPTKAHRQALARYGPTMYHRKSFRPLAQAMEAVDE